MEATYQLFWYNFSNREHFGYHFQYLIGSNFTRIQTAIINNAPIMQQCIFVTVETNTISIQQVKIKVMSREAQLLCQRLDRKQLQKYVRRKLCATYIFISRDQNAGENHKMKRGKGFSTGVADVKYSGNNPNKSKQHS